MRARGGFEIEMRWIDGRLQIARIHSLLGNPIRLRTDSAVRVQAPGGQVPIERPEDHLAVFETSKGVTYTVHPVD